MFCVPSRSIAPVCVDETMTTTVETGGRVRSGTASGGDGPPARGRPQSRQQRRRRYRRRRVIAVVLLALVAALVWLSFSLGGALMNPSYGSSLSARFAEWARLHGGASVVNWVENQWYSHHQPPVGGKPPPGAIVVPKHREKVIVAGPAHLPPPASMTPVANPPQPGEGQWSAAGRTIHGIPAVYETTLRPDAIHTSQVVGVAWLDTKLLRATLYSGSIIPGGGPYTHTAPVQLGASTSLVAAFNAGFLMNDSQGGYYTDGKTQAPLRNGAASFVVYKNGDATVAQWGRDATMNPNVVSVRQNLDLLVDHGQPAPGLSAADTSKWGVTVGNAIYVWRSAVGVTANGALVYVGGPSLNITDLANLLVDAGAVRGMELDINQDWVNLATYAPTPATGAATPANGTNLVPGMTGGTSRYFESWWARDFIALSAR
jgi:hypothetical protein